MSQPVKCNTNTIMKWIRIALSLFVIGMGIYYKNWIGLLGVYTLYTAITGSCCAMIPLPKSGPSKPPELTEVTPRFPDPPQVD